MKTNDEVLQYLIDHNIEFDLYYHRPVHTIEQHNSLSLPKNEYIAKTIFLRDDQNKNYYLLSMHQEKKVCLNDLRMKLNSRPLSYASSEDLYTYLGLVPGSITPLGVLNDTKNNVSVYIDKWFENKEIGMHPLHNTETLFIKTSVLMSHFNNQQVEFKEF